MPITLKKRSNEILPETPITLKRRSIVLKRRRPELAETISKGVIKVARRTAQPEEAFATYDKWMAEQRELIKNRLLSAQVGRPYSENIMRELGGQVLDVLADPKWVIGSAMMGAGGDWVLTRAVQNPTFRAYAEKNLPKLLERKLRLQQLGLKELSALNA